MTTNQVLAGVGLILVLAVGSQVFASRLRVPALIILLPAGFIAGAMTTDGKLMPVTSAGTPELQSGDTVILLESVLVGS